MAYKLQRQSVDSMVILMAIFVITLAVNLQVPLYKRYADIAGYRQGFVSVTFASYVAGLIPVFFLLGGLADRVGNQVALALGLALALAGHVALICSPTIQTLLITRLLQGLSVGLGLTAGTARLVELGASPPRSARLSSAAVTLGLGSGGLATSVCLANPRVLVPLSYPLVALATLLCLCAVLHMPGQHPKNHRSLIRIPVISADNLPLGVAIFWSWSLTGIILATVPARLASMGNEGWSGLVVFFAISLGGLVQLGPDVRHPLRFVRIGYGLVAAAWLLLIVAVHEQAIGLFLAAAALSGLSSFGFTYVGGLTGTLRASPADRVRAIAGFYLLGYLGFGLPCIAVGYLTDHWGLERALITYAATVGTSLGLWNGWRSVRAQHALLRASASGSKREPSGVRPAPARSRYARPSDGWRSP